MREMIKENIIKNAIIVFILAILYSPINNYLVNIFLTLDKAFAGDILVAASIIAVIGCFGAFTFTYEKINAKSMGQRFLAHLTTGLMLLTIGISLIFTSVLISLIMGYFILVDVTLLLLYLMVVCYDFWDILRLFN